MIKTDIKCHWDLLYSAKRSKTNAKQQSYTKNTVQLSKITWLENVVKSKVVTLNDVTSLVN